PRSDGARSVLRAAAAHRRADVRAAEDFAGAARSAAEDDGLHDAGDVHRHQPVLAVGIDHLYPDQHFADDAATVVDEPSRAEAGQGDGQAGEGVKRQTMSTSEKASEVLRALLDKMHVEHEVVATEDAERVTLEVKGPETGLVIGKKGQTLDALQYLVNKIVSKGVPEDAESKPINVDAEGYRGRRAESLIELAHRLADKA